MPNYCIIKSAGQLIVELSVDNMLLAVGNFEVFEHHGNSIEGPFTLETGTAGKDTHPLTIDPSLLGSDYMNWKIRVCSQDNAQTEGTVSVKILQNGKECPTTAPLDTLLKDVPLCPSGDVTTIKDGVFFSLVN